MRIAGLLLLEEAVRADKELYASTISSSHALLAASAAALWVAIKFIGVRVTSPNGALMSQASQVFITNLVEQEAQLLISLEWGISAIFRRHGIAMS
jgi:1-aminocyclopropane-1-carboxylate deaminase/D-cysteine desulfhydrase-like pyridoxal-dependent ACC family enzyme